MGIHHGQLQKDSKVRITDKKFITSIAVLFLLGIIYVISSWNVSIQVTETEAKQLAEAAEAGIPKSYIPKLNVDGSDIDRFEYKEIKSILMSISKLDNKIRFSYILIKKGDKLCFLADSEHSSSKAYSPPGQEYTEADAEYFRPFNEEVTILTKPITDRWGKWVSVLVPMKDMETGEIIAVFAVDYPAENWNDYALMQMVQTMIVVVCIITVVIVLYFAFSQNIELRQEKDKLLESDAKLRESETLFRTMFDQATIGIAIGHNDSYIVSNDYSRPSVNKMVEKIMGRTKEELANLKWSDITHPDDLPKDIEQFEQFKAGKINGYDMEKRYIRPDGTEIWAHIIISSLHLENTMEYNHMCLISDISKRKEMEQALYDSERSKTVLMDNLPGMAYRCKYDRDWTMQFVSEGCFELTGYQPKSLLDNQEITFNDLIVPKYREYLWDKWKQLLKDHSKLKEEYELITASGEIKWVLEQGQGIYDDNGNTVALEGLLIDITERKKQEMKLEYINDHDYLTGLYNRRYFEEFITCDLQSGDLQKRAILLVSFRNFSIVNLTYGYYFGETLIVELADALTKVCYGNYHIFQLSTERFIFYVNSYKNKDELSALCHNIIEKIKIIPLAKTIRASIGVVEIDDVTTNADSILRKASIAVENVGEHQIFGYQFFDKEMETRIIREECIKRELVKAIDEKDEKSFYLEYQPILDLKTNTIHGFEALARLKSEDLGKIPPVEFIAIAEKAQLIVPLGRRIVRIACNFIKELETRGFDTVKLAVNVSVIQLLGDEFLFDLMNIIKETQITTSNLSIEITESVFSDNYNEINEKLEAIRTLGICTAIDDFGTGYSSLAREWELNVDYVKIDKYFMDKLLNHLNQEAITGDIISMAHKLGHKVVAEGIEEEYQKQYLLAHNCDYMQGYLFSKPLDSKSALATLEMPNSIVHANV